MKLLGKNAVLLLLVCLAGCSLAGKKSGTQIYTLQAEIERSNCRKPASLRVVAPRVAPGLDTARIAVLDGPNHLTYYNSVAWADNLPEVLQRYWLDAFNQWGGFGSVGSDMDTTYSDFMLFTDIYEFQLSTQGEPPSVRLRMTARLVNSKTNKVLVNIPVEESVAVETVHMDNIVRAFNLALNKATATIMEKIRPCTL